MSAMLTSISELVSVGALEFGDGYRTKRSEHGRPGFRIIRVADVFDNKVHLDGPDFVSHTKASAIGSKVGQTGDILLTTKGTVGRVAVLPPTEEPVVYSPQLCYFRVLDNTRIIPRFLRYWFNSQEFWDQASYRMNNTDMAAYINMADIRSLKISLPQLSVQQGIAEVLGAIDDKIAHNARVADTTDELASALAQKTFRNSPALTLEDIAVITMGSSPKGDTLNETQDGTVFYQGIRDFGLRSPVRRVWTTSPTRLAQISDTLLSVRAPVGTVNIAQEALCIGRGLASIRSVHGTPYSLFHAVRSSSVWQQYNAEGTVFGTINRKQLAAVRVSWNTPQQMIELEDSLRPLEELLRQTLETSRALGEMRDALLPQLMSGRIRVKDAEAVIGSVV